MADLVCIHGSLRRSCELCEMVLTITALKGQLVTAQGRYEEAESRLALLAKWEAGNISAERIAVLEAGIRVYRRTTNMLYYSDAVEAWEREHGKAVT